MGGVNCGAVAVAGAAVAGALAAVAAVDDDAEFTQLDTNDAALVAILASLDAGAAYIDWDGVVAAAAGAWVAA